MSNPEDDPNVPTNVNEAPRPVRDAVPVPGKRYTRQTRPLTPIAPGNTPLEEYESQLRDLKRARQALVDIAEFARAASEEKPDLVRVRGLLIKAGATDLDEAGCADIRRVGRVIHDLAHAALGVPPPPRHPGVR